jgi:hypothetical protein
MYNYTEPTGSELTKTPAISAYNGQVLTRAIHDPIEIFSILYTCKRNELADKERKANELMDQALKEWYYYEQRTSSSDRYNVSLGRYIDKAYFLENPIKCIHASAGCLYRFKTLEEMQRHRWKHGG